MGFFGFGDDDVAADADKSAVGEKRFRKQCYLLWNWQTFQTANAKTVYDNFAVLMGEPSQIINTLVSKKGVEELFTLKPYQVAALIPKIRIFKKQGEKTEELKFRDHTSAESIENITKTRFGRGDGIGLKSMGYDLQGGSTRGGPALVRKGVTKVDLTFMFQNLEMLLKREPGQPALIDLLTFPPGSKDATDKPKCKEGSPIAPDNMWDPDKFAIKLVYGWAVPSGDFITQDLKKVIRNSATTLLLELTTHDLDFKQDGTVELKANYMGYADSAMSDPSADIFWLGGERAKNKAMREKEVKDLKGDLDKTKKEEEAAKKEGDEDKIDAVDDAKEDTEDALSEKQEKATEEAADNKVFVYQRLLNALQTSGKIYYVDLNQEQIAAYLDDVAIHAYQSRAKKRDLTADEVAKLDEAKKHQAELEMAGGNKGPEIKKVDPADNDTPIGKISEEIGETVKDEADDPAEMKSELVELTKDELATEAKDPSNIRINYFYYGDLLNVVFGVLRGNPLAKNIRMLVGPISFTDTKTGKKTIISLADIPIDLDKFLEWFTRNVVGEGRQEYFLQDFIKDTIKDLIHAALGEGCWEGSGSPTPEPNVSMQNFSIPGKGPDGKEDRLPKGKKRLNINDIAIVPSADAVPDASNVDMAKIHQYVYLYAYSWSMQSLRGNPAEDFKRGIYHLNIGSDSGLVKNIKFSKIDNAKLAASRATSVQCDLRHLRHNYKASIDMIGNSLFTPGQMFYLNPSVMGVGDPQLRASVANALGLGGYYMITVVNGSLGPSGFNTSIEAIWQSGPNHSDPSTMNTPVDNLGGAPSNPTEAEIDAVPEIINPPTPTAGSQSPKTTTSNPLPEPPPPATKPAVPSPPPKPPPPPPEEKTPEEKAAEWQAKGKYLRWRKKQIKRAAQRHVGMIAKMRKKGQAAHGAFTLMLDGKAVPDAEIDAALSPAEKAALKNAETHPGYTPKQKEALEAQEKMKKTLEGD